MANKEISDKSETTTTKRLISEIEYYLKTRIFPKDRTLKKEVIDILDKLKNPNTPDDTLRELYYLYGTEYRKRIFLLYNISIDTIINEITHLNFDNFSIDLIDSALSILNILRDSNSSKDLLEEVYLDYESLKDDIIQSLNDYTLQIDHSK